jgi:N-acetylmuramoyl-L-alanine amidase
MTRTTFFMFIILLFSLSSFAADSHPPNPNYTAPEGEPLKGLRICVDPGHGGQTWGATRGYTGGTRSAVSDQTESDANLRVGMFLWDLLTQAGAEVVMTRTYETRLSDDCKAEPGSDEWKANRREELNIRVRVAEKNNCDMFLAIHHNAGGGPDTNFSCVFYYDPGDAEGALQSKENVAMAKSLAESITKGLEKRIGLKTRPARSGDYHVLRENPLPAVIIECAFMPNVDQAIWMEDLAYSRLAAIGIFEGVLEVATGSKEADIKAEDGDAEKKPDAEPSKSKEEVKS